MQTLVHYSLHFLAPLAIAFLWKKTEWKKTYVILLATMLVDIDHLWANPIFDPNRCSIGFHTFHSYPAIGAYVLGFLLVKNSTFKLIFLGLLVHMFTDALDCLWSHYL